MDTVTQVQNQDKTVWILQSANTLEKETRPTIPEIVFLLQEWLPNQG